MRGAGVIKWLGWMVGYGFYRWFLHLKDRALFQITRVPGCRIQPPKHGIGLMIWLAVWLRGIFFTGNIYTLHLKYRKIQEKNRRQRLKNNLTAFKNTNFPILPTKRRSNTSITKGSCPLTSFSWTPPRWHRSAVATVTRVTKKTPMAWHHGVLAKRSAHPAIGRWNCCQSWRNHINLLVGRSPRCKVSCWTFLWPFFGRKMDHPDTLIHTSSVFVVAWWCGPHKLSQKNLKTLQPGNRVDEMRWLLLMYNIIPPTRKYYNQSIYDSL